MQRKLKNYKNDYIDNDRLQKQYGFINRGRQKIYAIIPIEDDDLAITPELATKIEQARQEYKEGKTISLNSHEDIDRYLDSM